MPCPFCMIAGGIPSSSSPAIVRSQFGAAYPVLSTASVVAFLDIAPLSRGHVLLCPRQHRATGIDLTVAESAALGVWLPLLTRAVLRAVAPEDSSSSELEPASWNVIQANGAEAGQTVPHSHVHIIPRAGTRAASDVSDAERKNVALGEGPRGKLDDAEGVELSRLIQAELEKEVKVLRAGGEAFEVVEEEGLYLRTKERGFKL